jgi:tetratricopeptide (TPR) repeat protein
VLAVSGFYALCNSNFCNGDNFSMSDTLGGNEVGGIADSDEPPFVVDEESRQLFEAGQFERIVARCNDRIQNDPNDISAYWLRAVTKGKLQQFDEAIKDIDAVLAVKPASEWAATNKATILLKQSKFDDVIAVCDEWIKTASNAHWFYSLRAQAFRKKGQLDAAKFDIDAAIKLASSEPEYYLLRGKIHEERFDLESAQSDYRISTELCETSKPAWVLRATVAFKRDCLEDAASCLSKVIALDPTDSSIYLFRADVFEALEDFKSQKSDLEIAARLAPLSQIALNHLAFFLATTQDGQLREPQRAIALARQCCELTEWKDCGQIAALATAHAQAGQFEKAEQFQLRALTIAADADLQRLQDRLAMYRNRQRPFPILIESEYR